MTHAHALTAFFGERDRIARGWLSDVAGELVAQRGVGASVVLRASEGFGARHVERSADLLTLSDDLPLVLEAFDLPATIDALLADLTALQPGIPTFRAAGRLVADDAHELDDDDDDDDDAQLTVLIARGEVVDGRPAHRWLVDRLHARGTGGATVLLGVDGSIAGARMRSRFLSVNRGVPLPVVAVGARGALGTAARELRTKLPDAPMLIEPARVLKRDGARVQALPAPGDDPDAPWCFTVHAGMRSGRDGRPLGAALARALRGAGAPGVTSVRGIWGFHGDHAPHGDRFWAVARGVPLMTTAVVPARDAAATYAVIDGLCDETGLVVLRRGLA